MNSPMSDDLNVISAVKKKLFRLVSSVSAYHAFEVFSDVRSTSRHHLSTKLGISSLG
jgi:hypothetical protein